MRVVRLDYPNWVPELRDMVHPTAGEQGIQCGATAQSQVEARERSDV